jgi:hypothetical protein
MRFFALLVFSFLTLAVNAQVSDTLIVTKHVPFGFKSGDSTRVMKALILHSTFNASFPTIQEPDTFSVDETHYTTTNQFGLFNVKIVQKK